MDRRKYKIILGMIFVLVFAIGGLFVWRFLFSGDDGPDSLVPDDGSLPAISDRTPLPTPTARIALFDTKEWAVSDEEIADFDGDGKKENAFLLLKKSENTLCLECSGADFRVVIGNGDSSVFDTKATTVLKNPLGSHGEYSYFMSADITGDKKPELIFTTYREENDGTVKRSAHIISFSSVSGAYFDIAPKNDSDIFYNEGFGFVEAGGKLYIVTAVSDDKVMTCPTCDNRYNFNVLKWNGVGFEIFKKITGNKDYYSGEDAILDEMIRITGEISK